MSDYHFGFEDAENQYKDRIAELKAERDELQDQLACAADALNVTARVMNFDEVESPYRDLRLRDAIKRVEPAHVQALHRAHRENDKLRKENESLKNRCEFYSDSIDRWVRHESNLRADLDRAHEVMRKVAQSYYHSGLEKYLNDLDRQEREAREEPKS